jgi:AmmeMemoRadiSam system protein A
MAAQRESTQQQQGSGGVVAAGLSPHPPIIIPEIGGADLARADRTVNGLTELARRVVAAAPATVVVISPHGPVLRNSFIVYGSPAVGGDFGEFGVPGVSLRFATDLAYVAALKRDAAAAGISVTDLAADSVVDRGDDLASLHYAVLVPLSYLRRAGFGGQVVVINTAYTALAKCYRFGQLLELTARQAGIRTAVLASGDLSHRLEPSSPAGYDPRGAEFDRQVMQALRADDPESLLHLDAELVEAAGECGLRPVLAMFGAARAAGLRPEVLSYEGPFGVGYGTAFFGPRLNHEADIAEHPLVALARRTISAYVRTGQVIQPPDGALAPDLPSAAGVFVSLHRRGRLRGCIGTIAPTRARLAEEVIHNAIAAATEDPRFHPLGQSELSDLEISVDVLQPPEPIEGPDQLDPSRYGVIVESRGRRGLLLPDLEGVETVEDQITIAAEKAGLNPADPNLRLSRFRVDRYH